MSFMRWLRGEYADLEERFDILQASADALRKNFNTNVADRAKLITLHREQLEDVETRVAAALDANMILAEDNEKWIGNNNRLKELLHNALVSKPAAPKKPSRRAVKPRAAAKKVVRKK